MFKVSPASLQTFIDTPNCVLEDRVQYSMDHILNVFCDGHLQIINCVGIVTARCTDFLITLYKVPHQNLNIKSAFAILQTGRSHSTWGYVQKKPKCSNKLCFKIMYRRNKRRKEASRLCFMTYLLPYIWAVWPCSFRTCYIGHII